MEAIVLAGHGSRAAEANAALAALAGRLGEQLGVPVRPGYLEMTSPTIPEAIAEAVASGGRRVVILPYFLQPGMHVRRDLVEIAEAARAAHPGVTIELAPFLGSHPGVGDILLQIARATLAPA